MNTPNKLTILRVIMIPFFVFFMLADMRECRKIYRTGFVHCSQSDRHSWTVILPENTTR